MGETYSQLGHVPILHIRVRGFIVPLKVNSSDCLSDPLVHEPTMAEQLLWLGPLVRSELPCLARRQDADYSLPSHEFTTLVTTYHASCPNFCSASTPSTTKYLTGFSSARQSRTLRRLTSRSFPVHRQYVLNSNVTFSCLVGARNL